MIKHNTTRNALLAAVVLAGCLLATTTIPTVVDAKIKGNPTVVEARIKGIVPVFPLFGE